jgi:hypothetical protein
VGEADEGKLAGEEVVVAALEPTGSSSNKLNKGKAGFMISFVPQKCGDLRAERFGE